MPKKKSTRLSDPRRLYALIFLVLGLVALFSPCSRHFRCLNNSCTYETPALWDFGHPLRFNLTQASNISYEIHTSKGSTTYTVYLTVQGKKLEIASKGLYREAKELVSDLQSAQRHSEFSLIEISQDNHLVNFFVFILLSLGACLLWVSVRVKKNGTKKKTQNKKSAIAEKDGEEQE